MTQAQSNKRTSLLLTLTLSRIAPQTRSLLTTLLLIEIGTTFGTPVGVTNQMKSITSMLSIVMGLLMGIISVKINHKTLILSGLLLCTISCIGCYFAPSFSILVILFGLGGIASSIVFPMSTALVGQHIPREGRANALSYLMMGGALLYLIGLPLVNYLGNWRHSFLFFALPTLLMSLILCIVFIPKTESSQEGSDVLAGYKGVFSNKSAIATLLGHACSTSVWIITLSLSASYFRQVFSMTRSNVVYLTLGIAFAYLVGAWLSRKVIPKYGRKKSTMYSLIMMGLFSLVYLSGVSFLLSLVCALFVGFFDGLNASSSQGLNLEQLPPLRGSMMSLVTAFGNIGNTVSLAISGFVLVSYDWRYLGGVVMVFSVLGLLILNYFAIEP